MKPKIFSLALLAVALLGAGGYRLYALGLKHGAMVHADMPASSPAPEAEPQNIMEGQEDATRRHMEQGIKAGDMDPVVGKKVLYYHDPMVPDKQFDKPGKSPFMDMMMVPVYADDDSDQGRITVSPRIQQNLGLRTAEVVEGTLAPQVSAVGSIAYNERDQVIVQARATGYVERLYVRANLDAVKQGQPLADLYVPDWVAAQEEFLSVRRMQGSDLLNLVDAARQRMRQAGMSDEQIRRVEQTGKTQPRITLSAPISGVVSELMAREGMSMMPGATLLRINGTSSVWANAEVPEGLVVQLRPGAKVQARSPAVPGITFEGSVQALVPEVNAGTRTLKARMQLDNPGMRLVPGMTVTMQFMNPRAEKAILIPTEAVIQSGKRTVVMLAEGQGHFRPVEVETGIESGGQTEIKRGLDAGQRVVVSSQFLIDSEASLKGVEARLNNESAPAAANTSPKHEGHAKVEAIGRDALTLSHGPIASLKWGAMTMDFKSPADGGLPAKLKVGDQVNFEFYMDADGMPQLTSVTLANTSKAGSQP
ncbi:efflux RND transporter periplasmic adaptor subunit [Aquabacterium sp.]|uniref:efflux RND transporter periplasmic adaptor subunit n=1 Tax=Aquabacterium sp. TaxID=1872578 RepID=UPI0035B34EE9